MFEVAGPTAGSSDLPCWVSCEFAFDFDLAFVSCRMIQAEEKNKKMFDILILCSRCYKGINRRSKVPPVMRHGW